MAKSNCPVCGRFRGSFHRCPSTGATPPTVAQARQTRPRRPGEATPWVVRVSEERGTAVLAYPDGQVKRKYYDEDGRGIGTQRLGLVERWRMRREIKSAVDAAWRTAEEHTPAWANQADRRPV